MCATGSFTVWQKMGLLWERRPRSSLGALLAHRIERNGQDCRVFAGGGEAISYKEMRSTKSSMPGVLGWFWRRRQFSS